MDTALDSLPPSVTCRTRSMNCSHGIPAVAGAGGTGVGATAGCGCFDFVLVALAMDALTLLSRARPRGSQGVEVLGDRFRRPPVDLPGLGALVLQERVGDVALDRLVPPGVLRLRGDDPAVGSGRVEFPRTGQADD